MDALVGGYISQQPDFQLFPAEENTHVSRYGGMSGFSEDYVSKSPIDDSADHSDAVLKFIEEMLMEEEDLENRPCMLLDCLALKATEKTLYDILNSSPQHFTFTNDQSGIQSQLLPSYFDDRQDSFLTSDKNNCHPQDTEEQRSSKQLAISTDADPEPFEISDPVLLCSFFNNMPAVADGLSDQDGIKKWQLLPKRGSNRGRPRGGSRKQDIIKEVVDLRSILMQCAQAVAELDTQTVTSLLLRIRQHSSPHGDGTERLAHYFANALEARLAGTGTALYAAISSTRISAANLLKAYKTFITACPFSKISNLLANKTIEKLSAGATTLHIIDFGILYGYQWPCLIQALSERPTGPPKLRITGIDFPQPGFRPAERVADTGRRLANYCNRFRVPFDFVAIAQKWETIRLEDLEVEKDEFVVVNSLYRLHNVVDESVTVNSPRDAVLNLIREINPDMFIHGVYNGTYNTPFFVTRFKEAMFHYSAMFDMFEATVGLEDPNRIMYEEQVFGKNAMNIIACEGMERVERPETYKQWQARNVRAGFQQVAHDREILEYVRNKVRRDYHKDFSVEEDGKWMLQSWKGRVINAISCWQPAPVTTPTKRM